MRFQVRKNLAIDELDQRCFRCRISGRRRGFRGRGGGFCSRWFCGGWCCGRFRRRWHCSGRDRWSRCRFVSCGNGSAGDGFARRLTLHSRSRCADRFSFRRGSCDGGVRYRRNHRLSDRLSGFRGGDSRSWLLRIVRNAFYDWLKRNRREETGTEFDEELHSSADETRTPDALLLDNADHELLREAIAELPLEFREILVLRELEGFSYKEIADVTEVPLGTVMSRLARAREHLRTLVLQRLEVK